MVTFCAFIVLLCIGQIECKSRDNGECAAICGKAEEMKRPEETMEELNGKKVDNTVRIINGYDAKPRGWMVMIRLNSLTDKENYETCGGALISKRHVLTAGHCVCFDNPNSNIDCKAGTLKYDPTKVITCYIGINSRKTSEALSSENIGMYEFGVEKVIKHEGWDGSGLTFPDLALIKLSKTVTFNPDLDLSPIVPICLPTIDVQLSDKIGYVAGWGKTRNDDCFTDNFGPERHAKCRSKFYYNGNLFNGCIRIATPSEGNIRCQQFKKQLGQSAMPKIGESIMILYNKGKQSTICYNEVPPELGWCGTCLKNAEPFTYGYCPPDGNTIETDELITRVKRAQHWGFCSKLCQGNDTVPKSLQETGVTILKEKECEIFNSSTLMYRPPNELCAGFKIPYPKMKVYIRKLKRQTDKNTKPSYTFKYVSEQKNPLGAKEEHSKLDFYLGFSDSCQGDSGGPLYRFVDGRAYVVGVVSRGDDCAGFNQPGIYTNVKHYLDWIQKHIKDGGC